jgi:hypothetical protein
VITNQIRGTSDPFHALRLASPKLRRPSRRVAGRRVRRRFRSAAASAPRDHAARAVRTAHCQIEAVKGLRGYGYSWAEIGARLGITRQAAQQRWGASP